MLGGLPVVALSVLLQKLQLVGMTIVNCDEPTQGSLTPLKYPFSDDPMTIAIFCEAEILNRVRANVYYKVTHCLC